MPLYEYICHICENEFEELTRTSTDEVKVRCPECGNREVSRKLSVFGFVSDGSLIQSVGGGGCTSCSKESCATCR